MDLETVIYTAEGGVARIVLNRPEKRNALNHQLLDDIDAAFEAAERDDSVRVVVLSGAGPSFCAGYDLAGSYYTTPPTGDGRWTLGSATMTLRGIEARYQRIWNCPKPTIAKVQGHVLAAGCYLQLLCDISVAAEDARLGHPAVKMGGASSMPLWQVALGLKKARYLLLTGRIIDGREAERIGLVSLSVPPDQLDDTVEGVVQDCLEVPFEGALQNKETLNTALEIMGVGALFRYHGQMNALGRLRGRSDEEHRWSRFRQ
ncbi:MAG TPA: enoyl-CoA hydratase/isomerase family protein [Tepidiformaceae bacterium]|nr:enoyl-CoA hydratase/isomerase family protein [Tepidiformaceae bacterium]